MNRYIIGVLALVGLVILLIVLITSNSSSHKTVKPPPQQATLPSYANTDAAVKMVIAGPIVAPQNHNSAEVSVSQYSANFDLIQGYDGNIISAKSFTNTQNSFKNFLYALYYAGYTDGTTSSYSSNIGLCATGDRYDFYLTENGKTIEHYWSTNCSGAPRTYLGNLGQTINLFNAQIPDIFQLSQGANI